MIDRNRSELELIRRYHDPDDEDRAEDTRGYVKWLGLWLKEGSIFRIGFGLCGLMVALLGVKTMLFNRFEWVPNGALWYEFGFLGIIMVLSFTAFSMFYCGSMTFKRQIRDIEVRMARRDNATPEEIEEVIRQTDKRLNRQTLFRALFSALAIIVLFPIFGTTLIFPWGDVIPFIGALVVVVGGGSTLWYCRGEIMRRLGSWFRRAPSQRA